jgi:flagellar motor switch protein FliG
LTLAVLLLGVFSMFVIFLFGPVRAFLNRLLTVLPRVGEQAAYAVNNVPAKPNGPGAAASNNGHFNSYAGNGNGKHVPEGVDMPFRFINEEILGKLPILLRQMPADQTAVVLAYLTPEWAGRVLNGLDTASQAAVVRELSQAREIPSAIVRDIETQVKAKLPYLVGGTDWIQSVYQLTEPTTQRALLGSLTQASPELAQTLRSKSFFYEDLGAITPAALRMVIQEAGYPTVAAALHDEKAEIRAALLGRLPVATREILEQEMEITAPDATAAMDAKARVAFAGRKLLTEGRIALPERK